VDELIGLIKEHGMWVEAEAAQCPDTTTWYTKP